MVWGGMKIPVTLGLTLLLCACSLIGDDGKFDMILVGTPDEMYARRPPLADAGQQMREATVDGLVGFDGAGQVAPALADRWIVTDDGKSYIFRMRDGVWPDGSELTGESVRDSLRRALVELRGTSLGLDLAPVSDIRAMAGRVVEIRLSTPMPDLLQLLAQPELGLTRRGRGSGLLPSPPKSVACLRWMGGTRMSATLRFGPSPPGGPLRCSTKAMWTWCWAEGWNISR